MSFFQGEYAEKRRGSRAELGVNQLSQGQPRKGYLTHFSLAHTPYVQMIPWKRMSMVTEKIGDRKLCFPC